MFKKFKQVAPALILTASVIFLPIAANAGGYEVAAHSAEGMGVSNAGATCGYSDGSALYFNPAAITSLETTTASVNMSYLSLAVKSEDQGSKTLVGTPINGDPTEREVSGAVVPATYLVHPINDRLSAGIFAVSPFGLGSEFDHDWTGRYQAIKSDLTTIQTGVGAGYEITDSLSLGASISSIYADATLSNSIDFGSIGVATLGAPTASALGLSPQANDGYSQVEGSDWGMAWSLGAAYSYGDKKQNRIGLMYRANTELNLHGGDATFDLPTAALPLTSTGAFTDTSTSASITLPEAIAFGTTNWVSEDWALLYESKWTRWTQFDEITFNFENPAQPDTTEVHQWQNTWRHSAGVKHVLSPDWGISAGFVFDQSPIGSSSTRSPRVPESDQYWASVGLSYKMTDRFTWNLAYQHVWVNDGHSDRVGAGGDTLVTDWKNSYDDFALGFVFKM